MRAGLRLGEALARCPDPAAGGAGSCGGGGRVGSRAGRAGGHRRGGRVRPAGAGVVRRGRPAAAARRAVEGVLAAVRRALRAPARLGVAPSRFAALAAAGRARARRAEVAPVLAGPRSRVPGAAAGRPAGRARGDGRRCPEPLERLGIRTLGELAALPRAALADRFGAAGPLAHDLARGRDTPLVPRTRAERLEEALELPESGSGVPARACARPAHRPAAGPPRAARAHAALRRAVRRAGGGRDVATRVTFREALADPRRMRLVLVAAADRAAGARRRRCACARRASARPRATSAPCSPSPPRCAPPACARRCARPAPWRGRTPPCASSRSIPTRACPSAAWRSRHGTRGSEVLVTGEPPGGHPPAPVGGRTR